MGTGKRIIIIVLRECCRGPSWSRGVTGLAISTYSNRCMWRIGGVIVIRLMASDTGVRNIRVIPVMTLVAGY